MSWTASPPSPARASRRAVRASRALRPELTDLRVGPMQVEILEPMRRIRVSLSDAPGRPRLRARVRGPGRAAARDALRASQVRPPDQPSRPLHADLPGQRLDPPRRPGAAGRRLACDARPLVGTALDDGPAHAARRSRPRRGRGRSPALPPVGPVSDDRRTPASSTPTRPSAGRPSTSRGDSPTRRDDRFAWWPAGTRWSTTRAHGTCAGGTLTLTDENGAIARAHDHAERHARGRPGLRVLRRLARRRQRRRLARRRAGRRARPLSRRGPTYRCPAHRTSR